MEKKTISDDSIKLTGFLAGKLPKVLGVVGVLSLILAFYLGSKDLHHFYYSYLVAFVFYVTISLGSMFFVLIQYLTRAGWSAVVRRIPETFMMNISVLVPFFIPIIVGMHDLFHWTHIEDYAHDPILAGKAPYLNVSFFIVRAILFFGTWIWLSRKFYIGSTTQDESKDEGITLQLRKASTYGVIIFAVTQTFAYVDWVMSLTPHWYSTIFGVYLFAGSIVICLSLTSITLLILRKFGFLRDIVTVEHFHDLGKLLYGFNVFWAYIAFSQYFLIWYSNVPEETIWYLEHFYGNWNTVAIVLAVGHFAIPFILFMSRHVKRNLTLHLIVAIWIALMHIVDLYWLIMPNVSKAGIHVSLADVLCIIGIGGIYFSSFFKRLASKNIVAKNDPLIQESLHFQNM